MIHSLFIGMFERRRQELGLRLQELELSTYRVQLEVDNFVRYDSPTITNFFVMAEAMTVRSRLQHRRT